MAILKSQAAKAKATTQPTTKEENQLRVAKHLEEVIGRPSSGAQETRTRAAAAAVLSGSMTAADANRLYAVSQSKIQTFIEQTFPTDEDRYKFLEDCMLTNSILASSQFASKFGELSAIDAARAASIFAGKATDIRKAREAGFKEAPINVTTIIALEKTLRALNPVTVAAE